jgi:hypothetical protein
VRKFSENQGPIVGGSLGAILGAIYAGIHRGVTEVAPTVATFLPAASVELGAAFTALIVAIVITYWTRPKKVTPNVPPASVPREGPSPGPDGR